MLSFLFSVTTVKLHGCILSEFPLVRLSVKMEKKIKDKNVTA